LSTAPRFPSHALPAGERPQVEKVRLTDDQQQLPLFGNTQSLFGTAGGA
jgi:hypothetical protein